MQYDLIAIIWIGPTPTRWTLDLDEPIHDYCVKSIRLTPQLKIYTADPVIV